MRSHPRLGIDDILTDTDEVILLCREIEVLKLTGVDDFFLFKLFI